MATKRSVQQRRRARRRAALVLVPTVAGVFVAGTAFAYWTTSGTGTGSGAVGTSTAVVVNAINSPSGLVPGGTPQPISFRINNTQTQNQYVTSVSISVASVTKAAGAPAGACAPDDFTVVQPNPINADLSAGTHDYDASYNATIQMVNKGTNQDGCKNATIALSLAAA